jgi:hypothetical protein
MNCFAARQGSADSQVYSSDGTALGPNSLLAPFVTVIVQLMYCFCWHALKNFFLPNQDLPAKISHCLQTKWRWWHRRVSHMIAMRWSQIPSTDASMVPRAV